MCGIAGVMATGTQSFPLDPVLDLMAESLAHRGPDASGTWSDTSAGVGLAHRRLSIVDLTDSGRQPMESKNARFQIVFNGEIYNHLGLREDLFSEGHRVSWKGHSDTETLLECISVWGIEKALQAFVGMFAFAMWDTREQTLTLARDRFGEKPLYYGRSNGVVVFGSELKAFAQVPGFQTTISRGGIALFMRYGYIPDPYSIFDEIVKLPAGTWVELPRALTSTRTLKEPQTYWSVTKVASEGQKNPLSFGGDQDATNQLELVLGNAVQAQMMGDVPLGAFLSGGIDSSLIVSLMQNRSQEPVKTFSMGFEDQEFDEAPQAKLVAAHLGTDHTELYVTHSDGIDLIPRLPEIYDEPFADSSQIPTFLVAKLAKSHVTVSLSGDAGDELFGGYNRYFEVAGRFPTLNKVPLGARLGLARMATSISPNSWSTLFRPLMGVLPESKRVRLVGDKIHKAAGVLGFSSSRDLYASLVSTGKPDSIVLGSQEPSQLFDDEWPIDSDLVHQMMVMDTLSYLPGDILTKVDRAAMASSLETRMPFLDHRVFEFAWKLPLEYKVRGGESKWILRNLLYQFVDKKLINRPKMGFGVPIEVWLRGPLRDWAEELLDPERIDSEGFLNSREIRTKWDEHLSGRRNWQYFLWNILMFQAWLEHSGHLTRPCRPI